LQKASQQGKAIHYLPQYRGCNILKLQGLLGIGPGQIAEQVSVELIKAVVEQRSKKTAEEVTEIEAALETCYKMQTTAMKATQAGLPERHVAGLMEGVVVSSGARLSFPTIFTVHGETLHNHYHGNMMQDGDIVINDSGAEFTLVLGDLTDRGLQQEFNWFADIVKRFDKPVLTVVGNHDGLSKGKDIYREMFGEFNYSFIYRDIKFIAWNNNPYEFNAPDLGWLRDEVESHSRVIVYAHQPPYGGSITDAQEAEWKEIRQSPNMIASIHGHTHKFNYYVEAGTGVPVYTTSRVENTKFGYMEIKADGVVFSECSPECREVN
jgi:predicted phosphodiesterase